MQIELTDEQHNEVEQIRLEVGKLAERLRLIHQEDDAPQDGPLWQASSLLHAADVKLYNYFDPKHTGNIDWQRVQPKR